MGHWHQSMRRWRVFAKIQLATVHFLTHFYLYLYCKTKSMRRRGVFAKIKLAPVHTWTDGRCQALQHFWLGAHFPFLLFFTILIWVYTVQGWCDDRQCLPRFKVFFIAHRIIIENHTVDPSWCEPCRTISKTEVDYYRASQDLTWFEQEEDFEQDL